MILMPLFYRKIYIYLLVHCHFCPIWPLVPPPNIAYMYFDSSFTTVGREPTPYRLLTFHISNPMPIFCYLRPFIQVIHPGLKPLVTFCKRLISYGEKLLAPRPPPKLVVHPLSAFCNGLFSIFTATFPSRRPVPPPSPTSGGHAMPYGWGTHLIWKITSSHVLNVFIGTGDIYKLHGSWSASELYWLSDRHWSANFSANVCR
jgi:hypothetical protein